VKPFAALVALDLRRLRPAVSLALVALAAGLVGFYRAAPALREAGIVSGGTATGHAAVAHAIAYAVAAATLLTTVLTAHLVAAERASGVLASVLVAPVPRPTWLAARACSAVLRAAGVVAVIALVAWLAGAALLDLGDVRDGRFVLAPAAEARAAVVQGTLHLVPPLVATAWLALALGTLLPGPALASSAAVLTLLAAAFVGAASSRMEPWLFTSYLPVLGRQSAITTAAGVAAGFADAVFEDAVLRRGLAVSLATAALAMGVAAIGVSRERLAWRET
jgi:hypothetical protein